MKIVVMGTGGTGGYYGALLARSGQDVTFIARGAHLQAIRRAGLEVRSVHGDFLLSPAQATDDPKTIAAPDVILFCTKTYDTDAAARLIAPIVGTQTAVLSLQNGIDAVERIGSLVGPQHMLAGATWISASIESPGVIRQVSDFRRLVLGEWDGRASPRARSLFEAFRMTGITAELSPQIRAVVWTKFVFIAAASSFGSLTRLPTAAYRSVPETRQLLARLMHEVAALARASGVTLEGDVVEKSLTFIDGNGPNMKASMQLDVEAGRRTELESMLGVIGRKGRALGVPTPTADVLYALLLPVELRARQAAADG
jgi:2-dehydropantoate 2-reductase